MAALAILLQDGQDVFVKRNVRRQRGVPRQNPGDQVSKHARILSRNFLEKNGIAAPPDFLEIFPG
jgi:hypothetical protein